MSTKGAIVIQPGASPLELDGRKFPSRKAALNVSPSTRGGAPGWITYPPSVLKETVEPRVLIATHSLAVVFLLNLAYNSPEIKTEAFLDVGNP